MKKKVDMEKFYFPFGPLLFLIASIITALIVNATVEVPYMVHKEYTTGECIRAFDPEGKEVSCDEATGKISDIVWVKPRTVEE